MKSRARLVWLGLALLLVGGVAMALGYYWGRGAGMRQALERLGPEDGQEMATDGGNP